MIEGFSNSAQNFGGGAAVPNNSGQGAGTQPPAEVLTGFNWGAFLLNWIWGCGNNTFITLVILVMAFIPIVNFFSLFVTIWFGIKGNEWAWQNKKWESVEDFHSVQRTWAKWGVILYIASIVLAILFMMVSAMLVSKSV